MSVSLDGITGNNLEEIINVTNKNFQKLNEVEFLKGDAGATLSIVNRDIDDELAKEIATCIVGDTEKVGYIDNIKENSIICIRLILTRPYMYILSELAESV